MAEPFSIHDQPDYERVYSEDDVIEVRRGDLRALLDLSTSSMDFGSGFWTEEETEIARKAAVTLGIDPIIVTPSDFVCKYKGHHTQAVWTDASGDIYYRDYCQFCGSHDL